MEEGFYHGESVRVWVWLRVLGDEHQQSSNSRLGLVEEGFYHGESVRMWVWMRVLGDEDQQSSNSMDWGWWRRDSTTVSL